MKEKFERKGIWWHPAKPEEKVQGTLHFDPLHGVTVDLFGRLPSDAPPQNQNELFWEATLILGHASNGEPMTLLYNHESSNTISIHAFYPDRFPETKIVSSVLIVGDHFERKEDIKFKKLSFQFSRAQDWANIVQFQPKQDDRTLAFSYTRPETLEMKLTDDLNLSLDFAVQAHHGLKDISMTKYVAWIVEAADEKNFDEWWKIQYLLGAFLTLATRHPVHPTDAHQTVGVEVQYPDGKIGKTYHKTELLWDAVERTDEDQTSGGSNMLFLLQDLGQGEEQKNNLEKCLRCWFAKAERLEAIYELYIGTIHNSHLYPSHRFLNLIQALESYHRGATGQDVILRMRLEQIVGIYEQVVNKQFARKADFVQLALDTRNYLTHYDPSKKERAAQHQELHDLSQSLQRMVEMSLLKELEIDDARISHILTRDKRQAAWLEKSQSTT